MTVEPDVERLAAAIRDLEEHLRKQEEAGWADSLARAASLIADGEAEGLYLFNRMFGGMGSLNDVVLKDGNEKLDELRGEAFRFAQAVKRSHLRI